MNTLVGRIDEQRGRLQVHWVTVASFAVVIAFGDGFWLTSMHGAVGAIERNQEPLGRWLRESMLMLPLFFFGVLAAIVLARRWFGRSRSRLLKIGATALLITVAGTAIGVAETAASSAYDYRLQTRSLERVVAFHHTHDDALAISGGVTTAAQGCTGLCAEKHLTLMSHLKAVELAAGLLLVSNLVLVLWVLMWRGDRLWRTARVDDDRRTGRGQPPVGFTVIGASVTPLITRTTS